MREVQQSSQQYISVGLPRDAGDLIWASGALLQQEEKELWN